MEFKQKRKVYFYDTDATGIVYHARHLEWMEASRDDFLAHTVKAVTKLDKEDKLAFTVINVNIDYRVPPVFEDELTISVSVINIEKVKMIIEQKVERISDGKLISKAKITLVALNTETKRARRIPNFVKKALKDYTNE